MNQSQQQLLNDVGLVLSLKDHPAWSVIMRDAQANFDALSMSWFELPEESAALREHRARQIANHTILTLMDRYEARFKEIGMELINDEHKDTIQSTDIDQQDPLMEEDNNDE